jgi:hypothetical protein
MRVRSLTGTLLTAAVAALVARPVALWAAPSAGEDGKVSKSSVAAAALTKALDKAKLQYFAAKDPAEPGRYVAAMLIPGNSMMLVSAKYASPALLNEKLLLGRFQDAYAELNAASELASRIICEDMRADGFTLTKTKDLARDSYETGGKRVVFDFDWRKQKLTQAEYFSTLEQADAQYARMLELLVAEAQKPR